MKDSKLVTIDPICGMTVDEESDLHTERDGKFYYFCSNHCLQLFLSTTVAFMPDDKSQIVKADNISNDTKSIPRIENIVQDENLKGEFKTSFIMQRMGQIMAPEPGNANEVEGVLNPAAVRDPDGNLYLFPRLVARGNYSRIGIARVLLNESGDPVGVERLGIALEPEADYECRSDGFGGCEDPRITYIETLKRYVMTYTGHSDIGPRIAIAVSEDLFHWERLGLATFGPYLGIDFARMNNKDASFFPVAIPNHAEKLQLGMVHRPLFAGSNPEETADQIACREVDIEHESIWISYCPISLDDSQPHHFGLFNSHHRLAFPTSP